MEDKDTKLGSANVNLDNTAYHGQGNSTQTKESQNQEAITAIKEEDKNGRRNEAKGSMRKGHDNADVGNLYRRVGNFKKAIYYHKKALEIAKHADDTAGKIDAYGNLGSDYFYLGDFEEAKENYITAMVKAEDADDKDRLGKAYSNLGKVLYSLNNIKDGLENHKKHLEIAESQEDEKDQGCACGNIGIGYCRLGKFDKAKEFHKKQLSIAKKVGNKDEQANANLNLGIVFRKLHHFKRACFYLKRGQKIARELPDKALQGNASYLNGRNFECLGFLGFAVQEYQSSVKLYDEMRDSPNMEDSWKITFRDSHQVAYTALWRTLLKRQKTDVALYAAEQGRAQALVDLLHLKCGVKGSVHSEDKIRSFISKELATQTVFFAIESSKIHFWVIVKGGKVHYRQKKVEVGAIIHYSTQHVFADAEQSTNSLCALYKLIIEPIRNLLDDGELILVPDHQLFLVPYNALQHTNDDLKKTKYLFESFAIRTAPSLII